MRKRKQRHGTEKEKTYRSARPICNHVRLPGCAVLGESTALNPPPPSPYSPALLLRLSARPNRLPYLLSCNLHTRVHTAGEILPLDKQTELDRSVCVYMSYPRPHLHKWSRATNTNVSVRLHYKETRRPGRYCEEASRTPGERQKQERFGRHSTEKDLWGLLKERSFLSSRETLTRQAAPHPPRPLYVRRRRHSGHRKTD